MHVFTDITKRELVSDILLRAKSYLNDAVEFYPFGILLDKSNKVEPVSSHFLRKGKECLHQLHKVARQVRPDRIVLSCLQDKNDNLSQAKEYLENLLGDQQVRPEVVPIVINVPTFSIFRASRTRPYIRAAAKLFPIWRLLSSCISEI